MENEKVTEQNVPEQNTSAEQDVKVQEVSGTKENPVSENKKKKNGFVKFLKFILFFILGIISLIILWTAFSALDRKSPLDIIPQGYSLYLHTDSLYESVNPLLDLQAADIFFAGKNMADIRGIFMTLRKSELRENRFVRFVLSRKIDAALYSKKESSGALLGSIDMGLFSGITRLAEFIVPKIPVQGLSEISSGGISYIEYKAGNLSFYIKPVKNLVIFSNDFETFCNSLNGKYYSLYNDEQKEILNKKTDSPLKLVVDAKALLLTLAGENELLSQLSTIIPDTSLSVISFSITDQQIYLNATLPVNPIEKNSSDAKYESLIKLLHKKSTAPDIVSRLSNIIQYYTVLNAGSLDELLEAVIPFTGDEQKTRDLLKTADSLCNFLFKISFDDLLFSWTSGEYTVMGIEGLNDPVFAIKIGNEAKRKEVFDSIFNSFLLNENKSLILNGVRIPRLELPDFLSGLLKAFKIDLPKPYYLVYNNYIYFSQSAECLSQIYGTFSNGQQIAKNANWQIVSEKLSDEASISLFYDLERSRPFFIGNNSTLSDVLELYTVGRLDIEVLDNAINLSLSAASKRAGSLKNIPGFPVKLDGKHNGELLVCNVKKPETVFWLEDNQHIKAMDIQKAQSYFYELADSAYICPAVVNGKEKIYAVTYHGLVYLFNQKLELEQGYPLSGIGEPQGKPQTIGGALYVPQKSGDCIVIENRRKKVKKFDLDIFEDSKINCSYGNVYSTIYEKGFIGKIFVLKNLECINADQPVLLNEIGYGSPCVLEKDKNNYFLGFVTQSGKLHIWRNGIEEYEPVELEGIFFTNLVQNGKYFFALNSTGAIFRIDPETLEVMCVQLDNVTTKEGIISACKTDAEKINIFISIDGNKIYGFNSGLELLPGFPIAATGIPVFADVNGDKYSDCFALTIDNKLNAWNLR